MISCVSNLLATATGPSRLRSELRSKTKPLNSLLLAINAPSCVKTRVPVSVLGGDIFALFSERLQKALLYVEEPEMMGSASLRKFRFPDRADADRSSTIGVRSSHALEQALSLKREGLNFVNMAQPERFPVSRSTDSERRAASINPAPRHESRRKSGRESYAGQMELSGKKEPSLKVTSNSAISKSRYYVPDVTEVPDYLPDQILEVPDKYKPANPEDGGAVVEPYRKALLPASILVEKLKDYWELSQREQGTQNDLNQEGGISKEAGKNVSSFMSPPGTSNTHSWPETTGQQISQKIRSIVSGQEPFDLAEHTEIHNNSPGKVEVKNVFNIDMLANDSGSMNNLSEKIADILREQALQHGIDIT